MSASNLFMHYLALACDYDGTLATHGVVSPETIAALEQVQRSGRKLMMVTGRELRDLERVFPALEMFDCVVAENGALLYIPKSREERWLCEAPPRAFVERLAELGVEPLSVGRCIVATREPYEKLVLKAIQDLGLELQVIFNKGAVMVLPSGLNKGTGLAHAARELGLSPHNIVGIGDAENDHAFLKACECGVAVGDAVDTLKQRADAVMRGHNSAGARELISSLLNSDLAELGMPSQRHAILIGKDREGNEVNMPGYGACVLAAGPSGSGKSTAVTALVERFQQRAYQFCLIDPEGDFEGFPNAISVGNEQQQPSMEELAQLLENFEDTIVNLLGVPLPDRPELFAGCLSRVQEMRVRTGRPHWLVLDEVHHLLPKSWRPASIALPQVLESAIMITVHPDHVSRAVLDAVDTVLAVGENAEETIAAFCSAIGEAPPSMPDGLSPEKGEVIVWLRGKGKPPTPVRVEPGTAERRRHRRKYAQGDIQEKSFYFRGPEGKLNLRAQNLSMFVQMAEGVDEDTWLHHLQQNDYSTWIREAIKDATLADEVQSIENASLPAGDSRARIKDAIERQYTSAA
ncbi:MAG: HAD-IIB family hydrolase [Candidatus Korobacteraceae bacterium]